MWLEKLSISARSCDEIRIVEYFQVKRNCGLDALDVEILLGARVLGHPCARLRQAQTWRPTPFPKSTSLFYLSS